MKIFPAFLLFSLSFSLQAQTPSKQKLYTAKVITQRDTITCALYEVTDTTIAVVDIKLAKSSIDPTFHDINVIPVNELIHVKIRRTGAVRRTALTLGILGCLTGAIIGVLGRPEEEAIVPGGPIETFSAGYYAVQGALIGASIGGALGLVVGSGSRSFTIAQRQEIYHSHKNELIKYLYKPNQ